MDMLAAVLHAAGNLALALKEPVLEGPVGIAKEAGVVHALITHADLQASVALEMEMSSEVQIFRCAQERRAEKLIRDFAGITHILDVYSGKRMDKRESLLAHWSRVHILVATRQVHISAPPPNRSLTT
jgi:hypothetical protein